MGGEKEERGFSDREKAEERERERKEEVGKQWMSGLMYSYDVKKGGVFLRVIGDLH